MSFKVKSADGIARKGKTKGKSIVMKPATRPSNGK